LAARKQIGQDLEELGDVIDETQRNFLSLIEVIGPSA
jgi:hypothetical protein